MSFLNEVIILSSILARSFTKTDSLWMLWTSERASFSWVMFCVNSSTSWRNSSLILLSCFVA